MLHRTNYYIYLPRMCLKTNLQLYNEFTVYIHTYCHYFFFLQLPWKELKINIRFTRLK